MTYIRNQIHHFRTREPKDFDERKDLMQFVVAIKDTVQKDFNEEMCICISLH